jgi:hypothetical protein
MTRRSVPRDAPSSTLFFLRAQDHDAESERRRKHGAPVALTLSLAPFAASLQTIPSQPTESWAGDDASFVRCGNSALTQQPLAPGLNSIDT